jgi:ACS family hexuronate transporter-like MFS transporter
MARPLTSSPEPVPPVPGAPPLTRRAAWSIALAGTLAMAISFFDRQALSVLAPTVTAELHVSDAAYGWLGAAFSIAYLVGAPYAGWLIDRVGARKGMRGAITLWSIVAALHALAPGFGALVALRLALGLAESPSFPAAVQTVQRVLPPSDRARGMSTLFVGMSLGAMIVPPLAIAIQARFGWRVAFAATSCVGLLWIPLWWRVTSSPAARAALEPVALAPPHADATDAPGAMGSTGRRSAAIAAHPAVLRALLAIVAVTPFSAFAAAWEAKYYVRVFSFAQKDLGAYLMISAAFYDGGALLFGDLAARRARSVDHDGTAPRALFAVATLFAASGAASLGMAGTPLVAVMSMALGATGRGAIVTLLNSDMAARAPRAQVSAAAGVIASAQAAAHVIVNPIVGHAVQSSGYRGVLMGLAAWTLPGCIAWMAWEPRRSPNVG